MIYATGLECDVHNVKFLQVGCRIFKNRVSRDSLMSPKQTMYILVIFMFGNFMGVLNTHILQIV